MPANRKTSERLRAKLERELPALLGPHLRAGDKIEVRGPGVRRARAWTLALDMEFVP